MLEIATLEELARLHEQSTKMNGALIENLMTMVKGQANDLHERDQQIACLTGQLTGRDPIPMKLFCPRCGVQHVDAPEPANGWENPPHRSHKCHNCGCVWRPADVPTTGVLSIATRGENDSPYHPTEWVADLIDPTEAT